MKSIEVLAKKFGISDEASFWRLFWQFFKFGLVGLSNAAVSMLVYYIVLWLNPNCYLLGSILGTIISIANAFFWNDRFVFASDDKNVLRSLKRLGKTYVSYGATSAVSILLLYLEVELFGFSKVISPVVNIIILTPVNFIVNKFWTFKKKSI